jgi:hypothetical protein
MKYREVSTKCSKEGCENERANNQRYCKAHRADAERARRKRRSDEFKALVALRAQVVAGQIERFNAGQVQR